jgi:hypothetical protein
MRMLACLSVVIWTVVLTACASAPVFPVEGSMADLSDLAGQWDGTYTSPDLGREGTIWFKLTPGDKFARGDIRMIPRAKLYARAASDPLTWRELQPVEYLDIRFVRVSAANIFGELNRYWDPDAGCWAVTVFRGRLADGRLNGTFTTRHDTGKVVTGRWQAARETSK